MECFVLKGVSEDGNEIFTIEPAETVPKTRPATSANTITARV